MRSSSRNLWLSVAFVGVLVVGSVAAFVAGIRPVLGLDLEGGVSVVLAAPDGTPKAVMERWDRLAIPAPHRERSQIAYETGQEYIQAWYDAEAGKLDPFVLIVEDDAKVRGALREVFVEPANRAAAILRLAAMNLGRTQTALGAFYRRLAGRIGKPQALTATAPAHGRSEGLHHGKSSGRPGAGDPGEKRLGAPRKFPCE